MYKAKITSKGQITLPAEVRKALGLKPGGKVVFFEDGNGGFTVRRVGSIMDLEGYLAGIEVPRADAELNELIHQRAVELDEATKSNARQTSDSEAA